CPSEGSFAARNLSEGAHSFRVRAVDAAGNADPSPAAHAWDVAGVVVVQSMRPQVDVSWRGLRLHGSLQLALSMSGDARITIELRQGSAIKWLSKSLGVQAGASTVTLPLPGTLVPGPYVAVARGASRTGAVPAMRAP